MAICALGYLGVRSNNLNDWNEFAGKLLGMQSIDRAGKVASFRMDNYQQRLLVSNEPGDALAFMGWEVEQKADLQTIANTLDNAGYEVQSGSSELADQRFVGDLIYFNDPAGNRLELFSDPMLTTEPFVPGRPISGFKCGPVGMGHAVLHVKDAASLVPFYTDLLGFKLSDFGRSPIELYFFHVNDRHHSFALIGSGRTGFHHFMVEYENLDDVGQGYDIAQLNPESIAYTLGRHTNDYMTSFYTHSPSGFFVESGWGGRQIDPLTWEPEETNCGPSFWGHERLHLPESSRAAYRNMRLQLAENGERTPPVVDCPWLFNEFWHS